MHHLSATGNIALLDWWKASRFALLYDHDALKLATKFGQVASLEWWLQSGLELEYRFFDIEEAIEDNVVGRHEVQEFWEGLGYASALSTSDWTKARNLKKQNEQRACKRREAEGYCT